MNRRDRGQGRGPEVGATATVSGGRGRKLQPNRSSRLKQTYDVFISHASEDKGFVRPLVAALKKARVRVWYDNDVMSWGDDLRGSIDEGLARCRYGIVVFSKSFLKGKKWTEHELNGLFARERLGKKIILPIWHKIERADLERYSPAFADRLAKNSQKDSVKAIVKSVKRILKGR